MVRSRRPTSPIATALGIAVIHHALSRFVERGRLIEGEFRPGGTQREWCESEVLRIVRRRSLAKLRKEAEPVDPPVLARLFTNWQGVTRKRRGLDGLLEVIESLQGFPMAASIFESEILAARVADYRPSDLDTLSAAGEIVWVGVEPLGERDGRIALYLTDHLPLLHVPHANDETKARIEEYLRAHGASFFHQLQAAIGGFPAEVIDALWDLVWKGVVTNDTFHALRAFARTSKGKSSQRPAAGSRFRSRPRRHALHRRRVAGRSCRRPPRMTRSAPMRSRSSCCRAMAWSRARRRRWRTSFGGFSAVYPILRAMEDAGRIRRGYFVAGLGATQFAGPGAIDLLRSMRDDAEKPETVMLAATDPANPYGAIVKWPESRFTMSRSVGAHVILVNGVMACYVSRGREAAAVVLAGRRAAALDDRARSSAAIGVTGE